MPVHRVDALERDQLRRRAIVLLELGLEVGKVVVAEDALRAAAVADAGDHGGVVLLVREDHKPGQKLRQRRQRRVVGDVGRGKEERRLLAVQIRELSLELHVIVAGTGDIARAAGAGTDGIDRLVHGGDDGRVLTHAEVVVGAPDRNGTRLPLALEVLGGGVRPAATLQVGEDAVAALPGGWPAALP